MIHLAHTPKDNLSKYLVTIVYNKDYYPEHEIDKYLPDGTINIIFELTGNPKYIHDNITHEKTIEYKDVWLSGVLTDYITITAHCEEMMVVVFKPGAGYPLTHKPAHTFTNTVVPAKDVFGDSVLKLLEQLKEPTTPEEKFQEIEHWLENQFKKDDFYTDIIEYAIHEIQTSSSQINISKLAERSGYSQKQFIELFKKYVGITPKQFHRITRFNEILAAVENKEKISWARIASECGYFDQAHFIKDFQSFSGLNPSKYLSDIGDYPNFFPVK
ncbi:AraC family transcriptional regulator [Winogradskyella sp. 3972H.M.0a.05]|uniref:AraC family transcriptional regulator n=1 Tax=Winogradskyella sp. 3972H.M.0a.05 TaxID=2950277 RepID=UPI003394F3A8